jgi:hypothetical protein
MHYAISEELFLQNTPILCPTCKCELIFVEPGTNLPLNPQPKCGVAESLASSQEDWGRAPVWEADESANAESETESGKDDWAAAAARWAESGFSASSMPEFIQEGQQLTEQTSAASSEQSAEDQTPKDTHQSEVPRDSMGQAAEGSLPEQALPEPQNFSPQLTPPPLPHSDLTPFGTPASSGPPPLEDVAAGDSGQASRRGIQANTPPWMSSSSQEGDSTQEQVEYMSMPDAKDPARCQTPAKPSSGLLVVLFYVFLLVLAAACAYAGWYFYQASLKDPSKESSLADVIPTPKVQPGSVAKPSVFLEKREGKPIPRKLTQEQKKGLKLYEEGNESIRRKGFKRAVSLFKKALKMDRQLARAHRGLGISYARLGRLKKACRAYRQYLQMIPENSKEVQEVKRIIRKCR